MSNYKGSPTLTNVTLSGNIANDDGGGMINLFSSPILINVTLSGNIAKDDGGGMFNFRGSSPTLINVIIWANGVDSIYNIIDSTPRISYSLIQGSGGSTNWESSYGTDGGSNIDDEPLFVDEPAPADAPSTDGDLHLQPESPAIDAGDNDAVPDDVTTDLDGNPRIDNEIVDMGAYEFQSLDVLDVDIDIKPGNYPNSINLNSNGKIRVAILSSETFDATTVDPYTVTLAGAEVVLKGNGKTPMASVNDVNGDGYDDLVVHVDT